MFDELSPGDRVEVDHLVTVGLRQLDDEDRRNGRANRAIAPRPALPRNFDDKVFSDVILLRLPDGELTSVTLDEFTTVRRA